MKGTNKASIILVVVGLIYAIAPDPLPGPIDDLALNLILDIVAFLIYKKGNKSEYHVGDGIGEETVKSSAIKAASYAATAAVGKKLGNSSPAFQDAAKNLASAAATDAVRKGFDKFSSRKAYTEEDTVHEEAVTPKECSKDTAEESAATRAKSF